MPSSGSRGACESELYPRTAESLGRLAASGHRLFVATAKAEVYARRIVERFGLARYFTKVYGATLSGAGSNKRELLTWLLAEERIEPEDSVMIGDRAGDVAGARATRMRSIGVLWGYGTAEELAESDLRARTWDELVREIDRMSVRGRASS
jgi:phosphoglycolate phosphatase